MIDGPVSRKEFEAFKELFREARTSDKEALKIALDASKEAIIKAEAANEKRLDLLNEFRQQSQDRDATFLRSETYGVNHAALTKVVDSLTERVSNLEGRLLGVTMLAAIAGIAGFIYAILK